MKMNLVSMKIEHKEEPRPAEVMYGSDRPEYPYGLRLHLNEEELKKLGITQLPDVGVEMLISAKVKVCSVNSYSSENGEHRGMELQIIEMGLGSKE
jgi:hypothetical protein